MKVIRVIAMLLLIPVLYVLFTIKSLGKSKRYRGEMLEGVLYELYTEGVRNATGKASPYYARKGATNKLMVYFSGGGASWSEESAGKPMSILKMMFSITSYYTPRTYKWMRTLLTGILAKKPENPFSDWNMVYIPYVTGDFHLGNNEFRYHAGKKTLYHVGESNTRLIMDKCKELFPETEMLLVCGDSAGAFGAAGNAALVAGYYPDVPVVVYSDASQLITPVWRKTAAEVWGVNPKLQPMVEEDGDLYFNLVEYSYGELGDRAVFLRSNTLYDDVLIQFGSTMHGGPHKVTPEAMKSYYDGLISTEKRFIGSGLPYYAFVTAHNKNPKTGLTQHTMSRAEKSVYFSGDVGISLSEWIVDAVNGICKSIGVDSNI